MKPFLYHFFHNETNDRGERGLVNVPRDETLLPADWKTLRYKTYPLCVPIALPEEGGTLFRNFLEKRTSSRGREKSGKLSLRALSYVLRCGYGLREANTELRTVPSAGPRYPLEVYTIIFDQYDGLEPGVYHYGVRSHTLEVVTRRKFTQEERKSHTSYDWLLGKSAMICLTGVFDRIAEHYGSRGYRYMLIEAGHVGQNMLLAGTELDLQGVPIGGVNESALEEALGLASTHEKIIYTIFF